MEKKLEFNHEFLHKFMNLKNIFFLSPSAIKHRTILVVKSRQIYGDVRIKIAQYQPKYECFNAPE